MLLRDRFSKNTECAVLAGKCRRGGYCVNAEKELVNL